MGGTGRRRSWLAARVVVISGLIAPQAAFGIGASIQETLRADGSGGMTVNSSNNPPGETWSWEVCPATGPGPCTPFGSGRQISTAGAAAEVFFRATSNLGHSGVSRIWHGTVTPLGPPSVTGAIRANELVTPVVGQWAGGWEGDYDEFQLAACIDPTGSDCVTLTHLHYPHGCPGGAAVIDRAFVGRHLRVANKRFGAESVFPAYAVNSPYGGQTWLPRADTSVATMGQIAAPIRRRAINCGPPPLAKRAASITRRGYAYVRCGLGCRAVLVAREGAKTARVAAELHPTLGAHRLRLRHGALADWRGVVTFVVKLDGKRVARRDLELG